MSESVNKVIVQLEVLNSPNNLNELKYVITNMNKKENNEIIKNFNSVGTPNILELTEPGKYDYGTSTNKHLGYFLVSGQDILNNKKIGIIIDFKSEQLIKEEIKNEKYIIEPLFNYDNKDKKYIILPRAYADAIELYDSNENKKTNLQIEIDKLKEIVNNSKFFLNKITTHNNDPNAHKSLTDELDKLNLINEHNQDILSHPVFLQKLKEIEDFITNYKNSYEYYTKLNNSKTTFIRENNVETTKIFYPKNAAEPVATSIKTGPITDPQTNNITYTTVLTANNNKIQINTVETQDGKYYEEIIQL